MNTLIEQDALIVVAEVSVAVAGFAGIIAAIGKPRDPFARLAIKNVVLGALGVVLFSLLPIVLSFSGLHDDWVWRVASGGYCVVGSVYYFANRGGIVQSTGRRIERVMIAGDAIVGLGLVAAVFGYPAPSYSFVYLGALYWSLVAICRYFSFSISSLWVGDD